MSNIPLVLVASSTQSSLLSVTHMSQECLGAVYSDKVTHKVLLDSSHPESGLV